MGVWLCFLPPGWGDARQCPGLGTPRSPLAPPCLGGRGQSETGFLPFSQPPARRLFALRPGSPLPGHSRAAAAAVCTGAMGTSRTPPATKAGASRLPRTRVPLLEHPRTPRWAPTRDGNLQCPRGRRGSCLPPAPAISRKGWPVPAWPRRVPGERGQRARRPPCGRQLGLKINTADLS